MNRWKKIDHYVIAVHKKTRRAYVLKRDYTLLIKDLVLTQEKYDEIRAQAIETWINWSCVHSPDWTRNGAIDPKDFCAYWMW